MSRSLPLDGEGSFIPLLPPGIDGAALLELGTDLVMHLLHPPLISLSQSHKGGSLQRLAVFGPSFVLRGHLGKT